MLAIPELVVVMWDARLGPVRGSDRLPNTKLTASTLLKAKSRTEAKSNRMGYSIPLE